MSSTKEILGMFRKVYEGQSQVENIEIIENKLKLKIYNKEVQNPALINFQLWK